MKITGKQLRQIIKEELARNAMNEEDPLDKVRSEVGAETAARAAAMLMSVEDNETSAAQTKMGSMGTSADRVASAIESRLTIDNPDAALLAGRPAIQAILKNIAAGRASVKMKGGRHPVVSVIKAAMQSALDELHDMLITKGATTSAEGATLGLKAIITKILLDDPVDASMLKYACAAAMSNLGMGGSGGVPSMNFDEETSEAAILIQHLAGLMTDAHVGKDTLDAIANPRIVIDV